jgi:hypothetical protein
MGKLVVLGLVLAFLATAFILASFLNSEVSGQVIAASASISVAVLGLWLYFKKPKN